MLNLNSCSFKLLAWKKEYESGHAAIDRQHRQLFADVNEVLAAMQGNKPKTEIRRLIEKLFTDTENHFREEEAVLSEVLYDETAIHALIHRQLLEKGARLVERFDENRLDFDEMFNYLARDVVMNHILKVDKKYFDRLDRAKITR